VRGAAWARPAAWAALTALALATAPGIAPLDPTLSGLGDALVLGCAAGGGTFALLARRRLPAVAIVALPRQRLLARSLVLTAKSAQEEVLRRALLLGVLVGPLDRLAALAASVVLFAGSHVRRQGRAATAHLLTGTAFGTVYLTTGRLLAPIAAHATYNVLIGAASMAEDSLSVSDNGRARSGLVASSPTLDRRPMPSASRPPAAAAVARLEGVVKSFGQVRALDGVDLALHRGEVLALLGPNGAGKSTAVAIMLGLRRPDRGRASLNGGDPREASSRRAVGAVLQDVGFLPSLRVRELVDLVRAHFRDPSSTEETLARLDLSSLADRQAAGLSGGQRRRLAVALALAGNPEVLFLDEPTAGMDAAGRRTLLRDVAEFAETGGAVLLTTQQLAEAEEIASRVALLTHGRIAVEGTVAEVRSRGGMTRVTVRARALPSLSGVTSIDSRGDRHVMLVSDADALVAELVRSDVAFRELEIVPVTLEDAFVAITAEEEP
jgi:ABC-2 type transport system ATP-binding protein